MTFGKKIIMATFCLLLIPQASKSMDYDGEEEVLNELWQELEEDPEALHKACEAGDLERVKLLVEAGADVNALNLDIDCEKPLHWAVRGSSHEKEIVQFLLDQGASIDAIEESYKMRPLHIAVINGRKALVELLLDRGAKIINDGDRFDQAPLDHAAENGHQEIVELLVQRGSLRDCNNGYALTQALDRHHYKVVEILRPCIRESNFRARHMASLLRMAVSRGDKETVKLLLEHTQEAKEYFKNSELLCTAVSENRQDMIDFLRKHNVPINAYNDNGTTPLYEAAEAGNEEIANILLSHNASINAVSGWLRNTSLHAAIMKNNHNMVKFLLQHNAALDVQNNEGATPLYNALVCGDRTMRNLVISDSFLLPDKQRIKKMQLGSLIEHCLNMILMNLEDYANEDILEKILPYLATNCADYALIADSMPLELQQKMVKCQTVNQQKKLLNAHCERHIRYVQRTLSIEPYELDSAVYIAEERNDDALLSFVTTLAQAQTFSDLSQELQDSIKCSLKKKLLMNDKN